MALSNILKSLAPIALDLAGAALGGRYTHDKEGAKDFAFEAGTKLGQTLLQNALAQKPSGMHGGPTDVNHMSSHDKAFSGAPEHNKQVKLVATPDVQEASRKHAIHMLTVGHAHETPPITNHAYHKPLDLKHSNELHSQAGSTSQNRYHTEKAYYLRNSYRKVKGKKKLSKEEFLAKKINEARYNKYKGRASSPKNIDNVSAKEVVFEQNI